MDIRGVSANKFIVNQELSILDANDDFCKNIGFTRAEYLLGFRDLKRYFKSYIEQFYKIRKVARNAVQENQDSFVLDCCMPVLGQKARWMRMQGHISDEQVEGFPVITAYYFDVDDLVRDNQENKEYFDMMMEEYTGSVYICDMERYELLYVNPEGSAVLGKKPEKMVGRKCYEAIHGRSTPCPFCTNEKITSDKFYKWNFDNEELGRTFLVKNRVINWRGRPARLELSHDMASMEYKLEKKERERDAILRTIPGGFVRIDARDFRTVLWYGADFLGIIGYTEKQFQKLQEGKKNYVHIEDEKLAYNAMKEVKESGEDAILEIRIVTHDGATKYLLITMCYVRGEDSWDGIPSFYSVSIDVTEERLEQQRQQKALEEAYVSARMANTAKTDFLSAMSHDIRTPMNAIMGMTTIAQANLYAPDKLRDCLSKINVSSQHLLSLINEVLDMSKIESGKIELVLGEIHLAELIENITNISRPLLNEKRQELSVNVGRIKHERIIADGERLQQIFMNLLSNAIKYTHGGGKISITINEGASIIEKKRQYEFVFRDNGIGISQEYIEKIFEPFSRAEDSRISKIQGTGLGLAITENMVRMMNGTIDVKSKIGVGSQFTVSVPFEVIAEEQQQSEGLEGLPVLIVDDEQVVCDNAVLLLNELGMNAEYVLTGTEALTKVSEAHKNNSDFFAIIIDWVMPDMSGLDTVRAIREEIDDDVPIIIISAYDFSQIQEEFTEAGADAFITKPLFKSKILHILQAFCDTSVERSKKKEEKPISPLLGKHVLLAEDNELNREIATELLQMQSLVVDAVENGELAVEAFENAPSGYYDCILMDIQMPVMNGYEATDKIRSLEKEGVEKIPIIALTANAFTTDVSRAHSTGMTDHIAKPIDVDHMIECLEKWIK